MTDFAFIYWSSLTPLCPSQSWLKVLRCWVVHPSVPFSVNVTSQEHLERTPPNVAQTSTWTQGWADLNLVVKDGGHCGHMLCHLWMQYLRKVWRDFIMKFYIQKVKYNISVAPQCSAKAFFWPLLNAMTQEQDCRLWPYLTSGQTLNEWHLSRVPTLKLCWLLRSSVLQGCRCLWNVQVLEFETFLQQHPPRKRQSF